LLDPLEDIRCGGFLLAAARKRGILILSHASRSLEITEMLMASEATSRARKGKAATFTGQQQ
jgi:hypothetical protein